MKYRLKEESAELTKALIVAGIVIVSVCFLFSRFDQIMFWVNKFITVAMPFVFGMAMAFLLSPVQNFVENKLLKDVKMPFKMKRILGVVSALGFLFILIGGVLALLIPQLYISVTTLSLSMNQYIEQGQNYLESLVFNNAFYKAAFEYIYISGEKIVTSMLAGMQQYLPQIVDYSMGFIMNVMSFFIGIFIAFYILMSKERFGSQFRRILYAFTPKKFADSTLKLTALSSKMFNSFVVGKFIDSLIIGIICFIGMVIFKMPYALLISFIVGMTNMIPVFGPFIGAIPGIFILLIVDPIDALWFGVWILVLQQVDGNIIGPYILGDSVGLPSLWIMFSIIVGGGFFGIVGMFLGVPFFSVVYIVIKDIVQERLEKKKLVIE